MIYVSIKLNIGGSYIVPITQMETIVDEIKEAVAEEDLDCEWTIKLIELTDEQYAELPEFAGH